MKYHLYVSDVPVGNQVVLTQSPDGGTCYISTNDFGYLKTGNGKFISEQHDWFKAMMRKSSRLNNVSEKYRKPWFDRLREKLSDLK
jgi:hypothetical protein